MGDRSAAGEDEAETEASVEPPEADCIPRDEDPPRPGGTGNVVPDQVGAGDDNGLLCCGCSRLPTVTQLFARNSA